VHFCLRDGNETTHAGELVQSREVGVDAGLSSERHSEVHPARAWCPEIHHRLILARFRTTGQVGSAAQSE
jgi:hypothetical protein